MMVWNEHDFAEAFGTTPDVGEFENSYIYTVEKDDLKLDVAIFHLTGDVYIDLFRKGTGAKVFSMQILDCPGAKRVKKENGLEYIEFAATGSFPNGYDGESVISEGVRVVVNPHIRVEGFGEKRQG